MSPGEQQRLAFARALLCKPAWLFLDEATAALDDVTQDYLYSQIKNRLPTTTILSIAHRADLQRFFHSKVLDLGRMVVIASKRWHFKTEERVVHACCSSSKPLVDTPESDLYAHL